MKYNINDFFLHKMELIAIQMSTSNYINLHKLEVELELKRRWASDWSKTTCVNQSKFKFFLSTATCSS